MDEKIGTWKRTIKHLKQLVDFQERWYELDLDSLPSSLRYVQDFLESNPAGTWIDMEDSDFQ